MIANDRYEFTSPSDMCSAVLVAEAVVAGYGAGRWNTPAGERPPQLDERQLIQGGYEIVTPFRVTAFVPLHDRRTQSTRQFVRLGGTVGSDSWSEQDYPVPAAGSHIVGLFMPDLVPGGSFTQQSMVLYAAYPIGAGGEVTLRPQTVENGEVSQTAIAEPLRDFQDTLAKCP